MFFYIPSVLALCDQSNQSKSTPQTNLNNLNSVTIHFWFTAAFLASVLGTLFWLWRGKEKFIYLFLWLVVSPYSRIFQLYADGQHYGWRKPNSAQGKPMTIRRLLTALPTYSWGGSQHELTASVFLKREGGDLLTCSLKQFFVQTRGDEGLSQVTEEAFQGSGYCIYLDVQRTDVQVTVCNHMPTTQNVPVNAYKIYVWMLMKYMCLCLQNIPVYANAAWNTCVCQGSQKW